MLSAITTNRNTYDWLLIIAAVLFFIGAATHLLRPPMTALGLALGCVGLVLLAVGLLFI